MNHSFFLKVIAVFFLCSYTSGQAQTYIHTYRWAVDTTLVVSVSEFVYRFPETHRPLEQSIQITKNDQVLIAGRDYSADPREGIIFFPPPSHNDTLRIQYQRQPLDLKESYRLFTIDTVEQRRAADTLAALEKQVRLRKVRYENPFDDFGTDLKKSGSIMRGIRIGSNRDLTLNSGLNLELSGKLSDNVEVIAALTDESTPIQPEGNTQTLDEVDRVFVEFKSPYIGGVVGDLNLTYDKTQFANLSRKLQGITLLGNYRNQFLGATIATTRGFFNRIQFIGQEGNQGPYQLTGKNGEREIIVLAGTERVWIDGRQMIRGEANDYVIEYGNGQIVFTNRRLITSESRIEIDYEYFPAIQKFNRNAYSGQAGGEISGGTLSYRTSYYREQDNIGQVLGEAETLTEAEREVLKVSGDDALEAWTEGGKRVGDSLGNYVRTDTVIDNQSYAYYRYAGNRRGDYTVVFSYVGNKSGDYKKDRLGVYRWVGPQKGDYLPRKSIPLPSRHEVGDVQIKWKPYAGFNVGVEWAHTILDRNILSDLNDTDNRGNAWAFHADMDQKEISLFRRSLGKLRFGLDSKFIENRFAAVDRFNQPDHQRFWNLLGNARESNEEKSLQFTTNYSPVQSVTIGGNLGALSKSGFRSLRYAGQFRYLDKRFAEMNTEYEFIGSRLESEDIRNDWTRLSGDIRRTVWKVEPRAEYRFERRENETHLFLNGFEFDDYGMGVQLTGFQYVLGVAQVNQRKDRVFDVTGHGRLLPQSETVTKRLRLELQNMESTTASLELVRRDKDYEARFEEIRVDTVKLLYADAAVQDTVWQDRSTNLADLNISHARWKKAFTTSLQYRISTEQTALKEKVYLDVGEGRGNLRYDEDLNEYVPDADGKFILFVLPSGRFEPVTNLETALRFQYDPGRFWGTSDLPIHRLLSKISGESYFRIEEQTNESNLRSLYTLDLSRFQNDQTLRGVMVYNQDLYLLRRNRTVSFRLQYRYRDDLFNQYLDPDENEDRLSIDRSVRMDWRLTNQLKSQSEFSSRRITRESASNMSRNRNIGGYIVDQKFSYRPFTRWELGLETELGSERNTTQTYPLKLWFGKGLLRVNYAIAGKTRISADYEYQQVNVTSNPLNLVVPYEMAKGKKEGASKKWQLRSEYTVAKNIVFTFFYSGRDEAGFRKTIHTGQAEVRAFF